MNDTNTNKKMKTAIKLFKTKQEVVDHASRMVALFWLQSTVRIIQAGNKPASLSHVAYEYAQAELSRDIYPFCFSEDSSHQVAIAAKQVALEYLRAGEYPEVAAYFNAHPSCVPSNKIIRN